MSLQDCRAQIRSRPQLTLIAVLVTSFFVAWSSAGAQNVGYHDFSYGATESAPTGQKPESKAWFNDGIWWASMYNTTLTQFDIYRLDLGTQKWTDTGTPIDDRVLSAADTLWDQASGKLYVVSNLHTTSAAPTSSSSNWGRLYRYTYNSGSQTYVLDSGFPVTVTKGKEEALVLAKDSTGELWVAYVESNKVMINHSNGSDNVWGNPVVLPASATAVSVESDDIATIISFGGNKIGVYWSNQKAAKDYFAIHLDGDADNVWQPEEIALGVGVNCTTLCADDHMNMKTDSAGKIYVASKTSATNTSSPLLNLLVRSTSGVWSRFTYSTKNYGNTRPIVLLDESHDRLYFFASSSESGADIDYKVTSMSSPSFPDGNGAQFIHSSTDKTINNATSTKQNLSSTTGLLVIASDDDTTNSYVHNYISLTPTNAPTVDSFTPTNGPSGTSVVLTGTKFTGASAVRFNGVTASFAVNSATQITATVPATATTGPISVTNSSGTGTSGSSFTVGTPAPTITSISPTSGIVGASVTITGTNYTGATGVAFNGTAVLSQNFTINSDTSINALVPSGATTGKITVTTPSGTATSASTFTVKPAIILLSPASGTIGLPVTINGTSLAGTTSVKFFNNKTATFTVISDTQVNTTVPTGSTTGNLTVTTPGGTATSPFTVAPPPALTSFSPPGGPVATTVTITGTNFGATQGASTVAFNGVIGAPTIWSNTSITVKVPAGATTGLIAVNAPGGPISSATSFLVTPVITGFSPASGGFGASVAITGTTFTGATAVKFNGTTATFSVTDDSHIATTVPPGATAGTLSVTTPGGTATSSGSFSVLPPTVITSFTPAGGAVGTSVTITGTNFGATQGTSTVKFNGVAASAATSWSATSITVQVPVNATIGPITVTTTGGVSTSATNFVPAPVISSFAPTSGSSGTQVLLTGSNFTGANAVAFNGVATATFTVDSDTSIHATVPAGGSSGPISVTTPVGGTGSTATNFTVSPLISSVNPTSAMIGDTVTITGSGFGISQGVSTLTFGGTPAAAISSWAPTSIQAKVPTASFGSNPIIVTVGGQPSNGFPFTVIPPITPPSPTITSFTPFEGIPGTTVTINGSNFTGTTSVTFNGIAASFVFVNDSQITAAVPSTPSLSTGPIGVTNGGGPTLTSSNFTVSTLIRRMTFEGPGGLTDGTTGGDSTTGAGIALDTTNSLKDTVSARVTNTGSYVSKTGMSADDLYVTFYLRLNALPAAAPRIAEIRTGATTPLNGTVVGNIDVSTGGALSLNSNTGTLVASSGVLAIGQTYRVLLHQKKGTGANGLLEAFLAQGETPFPGTPFAITATGAWTAPATVLNIGNTSSTAAADITFDNVQIDAGIPAGAVAPLINSLTPNNGYVGDSIVIAGLNFGAAQGSGFVTFNGTPAAVSDITSWSDTSITSKVPTNATTGNVVVTNNSNVISNAAPFTVNAVTISGINPTSGAIGATMTITGTGLDTVTQATINGTVATVIPVSATQIRLTVAAGSTGTGPIVVTAPSGSASSAPNNFTVVPPPAITGLSVPSGPVGQSITITGTDFGPSQVPGSKVTFNGASAPVTTWSDTSIIVPAPAGATTGNIVVSAAGVDSNGSAFTVTPAIINLSPNSGAVSASVTITGTSFGGSQGGSTVTFNNNQQAAVTNWSDTSITVNVPSGAITGNVIVTVDSNSSPGVNFTVIPPPSITNLSVGSAPVGSLVTLNGSNLGLSQGSSTVKFGAQTAAINSWTDTSITVTVPAFGTPGSVNVVVTVGGVDSNSSPFIVLPNITGISPGSGPANTPVIINGTTFGSSQGTVTFSGTNAANITGWSPTSISLTVPVGATPGIGSVVVTSGGQSSNGFNFTVIPPPSVTGVSPNSAFPGSTVTVQGTNLGASQGASTVTFNGTAATISGAWTDTSILVTVPSIASGPASVVVTVSNQPSNNGSFTVLPPPSNSPTINSFTPTSGTFGTTVTINGAFFSNAIDVKFNGTSAASFHVDSSTQITAIVPAGVTTGPISVTNTSGTTASSTNFTVSLIKLSTFENGTLTDPATGVTSTSGSGVSIETVAPLKGQFSGHVTAGSSWLQDTFAGKDDVYASFYLRLNALPSGAVRIAMFSDSGTTVGNLNLTTAGALTLRNNTTNIATSSPLIVGQIYRVALHQKKSTGNNAVLEGFLVQGDAAFGAPFASLSNGTWTTQADTFKVGATISTAVDLVADNIQIDTTLPVSAPAPGITGFSPTNGSVGTSVTITGANFGATQSGGSVKFNGVPATTTWTNTSLVATVPAGATTGPITVITAGGTASTVNLGTPNFTVAGGPTVTGFTPTAGLTGATVVISGIGFTGASAVKFNGIPASPYTVDTDGQITTTVPAGATSGLITVTTSNGTGTGANLFTVGAPNVTGFNPTSGPVGTSVTISGSNFGSAQGSSSVSFNGMVASAITSWTDSSITATVPSGATTGNVSVTTAAGTGASPGAFTVTVAPTVSGFSPVSGLVGASVTISGSALTGATQVKFNGASALSFTVDSDIQITATVPNGATTGAISVTAAGGTGSSASSFNVLPPSPSIASFSPTSGPVGTVVTINGSNLSNASSVTIAGVPATIGTNSASQIQATVGPGATTGLVIVTTPGGTADSSLDTPANFIAVGPPPPPTITSFTPTSGGTGTVVTINGANLTGTTAAKFNGTSATFSFVNDSQLTATVPAAATTGLISLTIGSAVTDTTNLNPANFTITRLKDITFEAGSLTGASGFGSTTGTMTLQTASPLKGADSMTVNDGSSYGTQTYTAMDEIFISLYIRIGAIPAGQVRLLRIVSGTTTLGAITLEKTTGVITLRNGSNPVGAASAPLTPGTLYRVGIHQKKGTGSNAVLEGFIATGNAAFGSPFASSTTQTLTSQTDSVQIGSTTGTAGSLTLDDIRLDRSSMPGPSVP